MNFLTTTKSSFLFITILFLSASIFNFYNGVDAHMRLVNPPPIGFVATNASIYPCGGIDPANASLTTTDFPNTSKFFLLFFFFVHAFHTIHYDLLFSDGQATVRFGDGNGTLLFYYTNVTVSGNNNNVYLRLYVYICVCV